LGVNHRWHRSNGLGDVCMFSKAVSPDIGIVERVSGVRGEEEFPFTSRVRMPRGVVWWNERGKKRRDRASYNVVAIACQLVDRARLFPISPRVFSVK